jgi:DNA-binding beta-propeller fold protein YncE
MAAALAAACCAVACLVPAGAAAAARPGPPRAAPGFRDWAAARGHHPSLVGDAGLSGWGHHRFGSVVLDGSPGNPAANPATATLYVPVQCRNPSTSATCAATASHVVDVVNTALCNTKTSSGCRVTARAMAGKGPLVVVVDERTDTVYAANQYANTVSVINGARCNVRVSTGCGRPVATVKVGKSPDAAVINPVTRTLYVANLAGGNISVINTAACNARTTRGCGRPPRTVADKFGAQWLDVNTATDTVYAGNPGSNGNGDTVSVINGATCNGRTGHGCGQIPATVRVGSGPFGVAVDQATDTVYVASNNAGTVSVINGASCNGTNTSGCHRTPPAVTTGAGAAFVAVDPRLHTAFVINGDDNTLSAINTRTCRGTATAGCQKPPPSQQALPNQGRGYLGFPNAFTLVSRTGSAYLVNVGGASILAVTSIRRCNSTSTSGCRRLAPAVPDHEYLLTADPATNTIYASHLLNSPSQRGRIDVINATTCNTSDLAGCAPVAEIPVPADVGALDDTTHTLYAANGSAGTVFVINTATCNATHTTDCAHTPPATAVGAAPGPPVLNPATRTLYVPLLQTTTADRIAVVNAATCNAETTSGCEQAPVTIKVGPGTSVLAVSAATDTIYAPSYASNTVAVINGATCNGTDHTGCTHLAATAQAGPGPVGVAVNDITHTAYVANIANGEAPGTVSVINTATCNGIHTSGCHRRFPVMATGRAPWLVAVDPRTGAVYVTDNASATVTILNGTRCDATVTSGCRTPGRQQAVASLPHALAINPRTHTVYVANFFQAGTMSIFNTTQH